MITNYLKTHYGHIVDQGWGAFETGNLQKAEEYFRAILQNEEDPKVSIFELVEAHNGMGAISLEHKDLFEAQRYYNEARYILDHYFKNAWPKELDWYDLHERAAMRAIIGLGHVAKDRGDFKEAKKYYSLLLKWDKEDELGVKKYLNEIEKELQRT
ncbi:MAG: hypothetical protein Q7R79_00025 [bacterium]|nr:hypothetical protein [bacterium]